MLKFSKLTRSALRNMNPGAVISEHGIIFKRLENGDGCYNVNIMVCGRRVHRVVGKESDGTTRSQVEEYIQKIKQEAKQGRLNLPKGRKVGFSFRDAAEKYLVKLHAEGGKDLKMKKMRLEHHLVPFFANSLLSNITSFDIARYKKHRLELNAAKGSVNRELAVLSHLFSKAIEWQWLDNKPARIERFKEDSGRITYLTIEQINRLLQAAQTDENSQIYPFIMIGLETAMRRMEILSIRLANVNLAQRVIYIPRAKSGAREQPMTARLAEFLQNYMPTINSHQPWLFPSARSALGYTNSIEKAFRRVVRRAGLDPKQIVRHTLRHTTITHLVQAGVDLPTVKRISGHKSLQMVERYSHQNGQHIQAAMDKLEQRYSISSS